MIPATNAIYLRAFDPVKGYDFEDWDLWRDIDYRLAFDVMFHYPSKLLFAIFHNTQHADQELRFYAVPLGYYAASKDDTIPAHPEKLAKLGKLALIAYLDYRGILEKYLGSPVVN